LTHLKRSDAAANQAAAYRRTLPDISANAFTPHRQQEANTALTIGAATAAGSFGGNYGANQLGPAPIVSSANSQALTPADFFAAGVACADYDTIGIDTGNPKIEAAKNTKKALMSAAIRAVGYDPAQCEKI